MAQQQVGDEAFRLSSQYQLGALKKEHSDKSWIGRLRFFIIFLVIPTALCVGIGIQIGILYAITCLLPFYAFFVFVSGMPILITYRRRHSRILLYEYGLIVVECRDERVVASEAIHWGDIVNIWHDVWSNNDNTIETCKLQDRNGSIFGENMEDKGPISFVGPGITLGMKREKGPILNNAQIITEIEQMTLPYLLPPALSKYQQGLPVSFGPLTISRNEGLKYQWEVLPWGAFERLKMSSGTLYIIQRRRQQLFGSKRTWAKVRYGEIPNLAVFAHLIESITATP